MATSGPKEMGFLNSQEGAGEDEDDEAVAFSKMAGRQPPPGTLPPLVARIEDGTAEEMKREIDNLERQIDADKAEMEGLIKRIGGLEGDRVFESDLFQSCRDLIYMRYARGLTPLSTTESTRLHEIQDLARDTMKQYEVANGNLPPFVVPSISKFPDLL